MSSVVATLPSSNSAAGASARGSPACHSSRRWNDSCRRPTGVPTRRQLSFHLRELWQAGLPRALAPAALFELGNVATTLLILRATDLLHAHGRSLTAATSLAILLYAAHNGVAALAAIGGGHAADRVGPRVVFACGAAVYVAGYGVFAADQHAWPLLLVGFMT